jgi:hypothetical protein
MMTGWMVGRSIRPCSTRFTLGSPSTTALPNASPLPTYTRTALLPQHLQKPHRPCIRRFLLLQVAIGFIGPHAGSRYNHHPPPSTALPIQNLDHFRVPPPDKGEECAPAPRRGGRRKRTPREGEGREKRRIGRRRWVWRRAGRIYSVAPPPTALPRSRLADQRPRGSRRGSGSGGGRGSVSSVRGRGSLAKTVERAGFVEVRGRWWWLSR